MVFSGVVNGVLVHYSFLVYFTNCEAHLIMHHGKLRYIRPCLHGVGDPGLVG